MFVLEQLFGDSEAEFLNTGARYCRDLVEREMMLTGFGLDGLDARAILAGIDFRGDDEHGLCQQIFAEAAELFEDDVEVMSGVAAAEIGNIDELY